MHGPLDQSVHPHTQSQNGHTNKLAIDLTVLLMKTHNHHTQELTSSTRRAKEFTRNEGIGPIKLDGGWRSAKPAMSRCFKQYLWRRITAAVLDRCHPRSRRVVEWLLSVARHDQDWPPSSPPPKWKRARGTNSRVDCSMIGRRERWNHE